MSAEEIRRHYQAALARRADPQSGVSVEQLEALAAHRLPEAEALALLDRVMADDGLRREYELLRSLHTAGAAVPPKRWLRPALALAAGLAAVVTIGNLVRAGREPAGTARGSGGTALLAQPASGAVATLPATLAWHPASGARSYRLQVLDPDGGVLMTRETTDTAITVQAGEVHAGPAHWWVEVRLTAGTGRSELRAVTFAER